MTRNSTHPLWVQILLHFTAALILFAPSRAHAEEQRDAAKDDPAQHDAAHYDPAFPVVDPAMATPGRKPEHGDPNQSEEPVTVRVIQVPKHDSFDRGLLAVNIVLALVGGFGSVLAFYTLRQVRRQAGLMERQESALERQIILQFRPKLVARNFIPLGEVLTITLTNTGGSRARLKTCQIICTLVSAEVTTQTARSQLDESSMGEGVELLPGESTVLHIDLSPEVQRVIQAEDRVASSVSDLYRKAILCAGIVRYLDDVGIVRDTIVGRWYQGTKRRFMASGDPEDDYAD